MSRRSREMCSEPNRFSMVRLNGPNKEKTRKFFNELNLENLEIYFDPEFGLSKKFKLRGIPTTILLNKDGNEFGRIMGEFDFGEENFINLLKSKANF